MLVNNQNDSIMKELKELTRANIWNLAPYSCARNEYNGRNASVSLDAIRSILKLMLCVIHDDTLLAILYDISTVEVVECASYFCRICVYALKHIVELLLETLSAAKRLKSVSLAVLFTLELVETLA